MTTQMAASKMAAELESWISPHWYHHLITKYSSSWKTIIKRCHTIDALKAIAMGTTDWPTYRARLRSYVFDYSMGKE